MGLSMELPIKVWVTYSGITKNNAMTWANKKKKKDKMRPSIAPIGLREAVTSIRDPPVRLNP